MPKPLSVDLRERIVAVVGAGCSRRAAAERFGVSASSAVRFVSLEAQTGSVAAKPMGGRRCSKLDAHRDFLLARVEAVCDITLPELAAELLERGVRIDPSSLSRWFILNGYSFKKNFAGQRARSTGCRKGARGLDIGAPASDAP
jgi:transposase